MPRPASPEVRSALIEGAAALLARREPVTLRSVAAAAQVSTMGVYTYFDGMPGLWAAVRQEGFTRLSARLATVRPSRDPVRRLAALGVAYAENAMANPDLFRVMFESAFALPDPEAAGSSFEPLVLGVKAAQQAERFDPGLDPGDVATRYWASGHGVTSLAVSGVLPREDLPRQAQAIAAAVFTAAGDAPHRARRSVAAAWRDSPLTSG